MKLCHGKKLNGLLLVMDPSSCLLVSRYTHEEKGSRKHLSRVFFARVSMHADIVSKRLYLTCR